ncbi:phage/plasmid replication protein [Spirosoma sp. KNUC1025]|uniref:phage/plasmid replication domain-containing protein n=1 Tax=Spirosoma sp. KNUC1025 TaxID=2894082 RepID=UPI00386B890C|nr:hypothetical protein LN737_01265 [Spirosoma sp. KNUC1025]
MDHVTEHYHANGQQSVSGYLSNLRVSAAGAGLWIKGSLCTYYHKNNFGNLTRQDTQRVIEQLSDILSLPINRANVGRVDVGKTMLTKHPPTVYLAELGLCKYYARLSQPKSIRYQNGKRVLAFYDKRAEGKQARLITPAIWTNKNTLRYEARFVSRLPKQFNRTEIVATDLYDEDFYIGLIDQWVSEFEKIQKVGRIDVNLEQAMKSVKDFSQTAERLLIQQLGGELAALELVELNRQKGEYKNRTEVKRLKDRIKELSQQSTGKSERAEAGSELMEELGAKVKRAQQYYR